MTTYPQRIKMPVTLFLVAMLLLNAFVFWIARRQAAAGSPDFSIFYTAGLMLRRGQGGSLYNNLSQLRVQREFALAARDRDGPLPYNHPPFEAALYIPLTYLSYLHAYELWAALNCFLLVGIALFLRPHIPHLRSAFPWMPLLAELAFFPIAYALMQGQDSIMLLALYCLAYAALRRGRELEAGAWLGLGLFKFHLVLPFVFILLLRRRLRAGLGVLLSGCLDGLISWALVGWRELLDYPRFTWEINRHPPMRAIVPRNMPNLRGLFTGWSGGPAASLWLEIVLLLVSVAMVMWAARQWEAADPSDAARWNNGFSIALIVTFLVSYHGYNQDMSILFLPLALLFDRLLQTRPQGWYNFALKLGLGLMFFSSLYQILTLHYSHQHLFALVLVGLACTLASWNASLKRSAWREGLPSLA
jgi:hypothetical protein